ncbi:MAG: CheR family methyltransferase [Bacilli bacterium]
MGQTMSYHPERSTSMDPEEIAALLALVYRLSGLDFRDYWLPMIRRRIRHTLELHNLRNIEELSGYIQRDEVVLRQLVSNFCITVSSMYRDPDVFFFIRQRVLPILRAKPFIRIWHAGCATGEEPYSLAIMLEQEGFEGRYRSYATDINSRALDQGRSAQFPLQAMQLNIKNYIRSGGSIPFCEYYDSKDRTTVLKEHVRRSVVFGKHSLVSDPAFNRFDVIFCRNVLIYFNTNLQEHVLHKLHDSLLDGGFLVLGARESMPFAFRSLNFDIVSREYQIYQKHSTEAIV